jgi:hypothetical protein
MEKFKRFNFLFASVCVLFSCRLQTSLLRKNQNFLEKTRSLPFKAPVQVEKVSVAAFKKMAGEIDDEQNRFQGWVFRLMGLINPDDDFASDLKKMVSGEARAFYHWKRHQLMISNEVPDSQLVEVL